MEDPGRPVAGLSLCGAFVDNGQPSTGQAAEARACRESISDGQSDHVLVSYLERCCTPLDSTMVALVIGLPENGLQGDS